MALSEIIINDVVTFYTNAVINESNYHILRQYLLEKKSLDPLINKMNTLLSEHCKADEHTWMMQLIQEACELQKNSDLQEAINDEHENNRDSALKQHYLSELMILEREEHYLNTPLKEKRQVNERYNELRHQLDIDLPQREQQRQIKYQERLARNNARALYDPHLQQLSYKNLEILKQQIATKNYELERKKNQLMDQAIESSYRIFLTQLALALEQSDRLQMTFNEIRALKSILEMMNNYLAMGEKERAIFRKLNDEKSDLREIRKNILETNAQVQSYISGEPKRVQQNKNLEQDNNQLDLQNKTAEYIKTSALYASLFGAGGAFFCSNMLHSLLLIHPAFLVAPGALALFTFVSLTVAVVYHYKKLANEEQLSQNIVTIAQNEKVIVKHWLKAHELSITTLPVLNAQLEKSENAVAQVKKELEEYQAEMSQLLAKAQTVTSIYGTANTFFGGTPKTEKLYPILPSAPPLYESSGEFVFH